MRFAIYQINHNRDKNHVSFSGLNALERLSGSRQIDVEIYDKVHEADVPCDDLETIYSISNTRQPNCFRGRHISVSDIIEVKESSILEKGFYFCNDIGFAKVDFAKTENPIWHQDSIVSVLESRKIRRKL